MKKKLENPSGWVVLKFGGTSVANSERMKVVSQLIKQSNSEKTTVVVSAMGGVTDALISLIPLAIQRESKLEIALLDLKTKHFEAINQLLPPQKRAVVVASIQKDFNDLSDILQAVSLVRECSDRTTDFISGLGEVWSSQILNGLLEAEQISSVWMDARKVLELTPAVPNPVIHWDSSEKLLNEFLKDHHQPKTLVITGFVGKTLQGIPATLGRNGSDYSAAIFGHLLSADRVEIWTDVDGVMSANPKLVPGAVVIPEMSYSEAMELAYFGAKVLHPNTMRPALEKEIPIIIRNTFNPSHPGTKITVRPETPSISPVKGFTHIEDVALINVEGTGMIGVPGITARLFHSLHEKGISVILISQASSEHSICFVVPENQAESAVKLTKRTFSLELTEGMISSVEKETGCVILAAVGDDMSGAPGVSAKLFTALGRAGVNVKSIAQGSSERNISVVISKEDSIRALRAVHAGFYLSKQTLSVGLIGPGTVGKTLLNQISEMTEKLTRDFGIDIRIRGIATSSKMLLDNHQIPLTKWKEVFDQKAKPLDMDHFIKHVHADYYPHTVLIDCTASNEIAKKYTQWLKQGIHIITPNKKANTLPFDYYRELKSEGRRYQKHYLYETTVGAGLPIIGTLNDLIQTGDEIIRIEGVLSGTMGYLFSNFDGQKPFSELVREAKNLGYTEPDPRDDLSGMDVVRKVVILAREIGLPLEVNDVMVKGFIPESLANVSIEDYLKGLTMMDNEMTDLVQSAKERKEVLRYVGVVDPSGNSRVELKSYPESHPFARVFGSDNIVAFTTKRYHKQPLIIQGPGAGPDVTAAGVFSDLLRIATYLGGSF